MGTKQLNISKATLRNWRMRYEQQRSSNGRQLLKEQEDMKRLRKSIRYPEEERDILKKAVGIFCMKNR